MNYMYSVHCTQTLFSRDKEKQLEMYVHIVAAEGINNIS